MLHPGHLRNYESTVMSLAARGHQIHLCFNQPEKQSEDRQVELISENNPNVTYSNQPIPRRSDKWRGFPKPICVIRDYLRYLNPRYKNTPKLKNRVEIKLKKTLKQSLQNNLIKDYDAVIKWLQTLSGNGRYSWLDKVLKIIYQSLPSDPSIEEFIKSHQADLVLVTPLITVGPSADQAEFLRSAKALKIPNGLCVGSWDNLTNKGLVHGDPDIVFVWNEIQKQESLELHGIPSKKVIVTGAQCYDKWFERKPASSKEIFCQKVGLNPEQPFILYLCSSPFIAPFEVDFIEKWIRQIRDCDNFILNHMGLLVRPHPQNADQWKGVDFSHLGNVTIWPQAGANPVSEDAKADFYDSLYHSVAAVGLNSSTMIEAGILNKPVFTITSPEFQDTQTGTLHFYYLVEGGLVRVNKNFEDHIEDLSKVLSENPDIYREKIKTFIQGFVRPHGLDVSCTPILVEAIEKMQSSKVKSSQYSLPLLSLAIRTIISPLILLFSKSKKKRQ